MLKNLLCSIFKHPKLKESTEELPGKEFRYVLSCSCGENKVKSVPLHDNDLLSNINITSRNFPIDETC